MVAKKKKLARKPAAQWGNAPRGRGQDTGRTDDSRRHRLPRSGTPAIPLRRRWRRACLVAVALVIAPCFGCRSEKRDSAQESRPAAAPVPRNTTASLEPAVPCDTATGTAPTGPLQEAEFIVAGLCRWGEPGWDSVSASQARGEPDGIEVEGDPWDTAGVRLWQFRSFGVEVVSYGLVRVTSPSIATARGVRVGDPVERVLSAYGGERPTINNAADTFELRYYTDFENPTEGFTDGILFGIGDDHVIEFRVGRISHVIEGSLRRDWEWDRPAWVISSEGLGPVGRQTSEQELIELLGRENVARDTTYLVEHQGKLGTVLFDETDRIVEIGWADRDAWRTIREMVIRGSVWRTRQGIGVGTSLRALEVLNGRAFTLSGFVYDNHGHGFSDVCSWEGGRMAALLRGVSISLGEINEGDLSLDDQRAIEGEECRSSSLPALQRAAPRVVEIRVVFRE